MAKEQIILGIDPGTTILGYGVIAVKNDNLSLITLGIIQLHKLNDHYLKLKRIFERTTSLIKTYSPDEVALEAPFYGKNVQSMLKLGRGQGVAMAAALHYSIPIFEYSPRKIKQSITGSGSASKEQVAGFLQNLFRIEKMPTHLDATDGLAVALCHYYQQSSPIPTGNSKQTWDDFIRQNPSRVK